MRSESEKKGKVTSVRLTEEEYLEFEEAAAKEGMTVSTLLRTCAKNRKSLYTPAQKVHTQNIANTAIELAREYSPEKIKFIESEMKKIWQ